ncbi:hypothetical protein NEOLEDRAFT_1139191 [Neolentinus lepideus HHB14362 ss-1]|uniref:RED-like N-terminal domain-containing protein n=1 Tax=Neolentinus lepideus HHB14362 ss-1 TaxID=1314782 RepID=A0A165PW20_9AGAM|nr:hypothetical protein NEOLEDRAFT_1139191 [Neolentinus lepideus HHB14362 ss-1]
MDQESFRKLLESGRATQSNANGTPTAPRGTLLGQAKTKAKTIDASEPAFKPRKLKKSGRYRDRASERREGVGNDFAEAEALLEDFEKRYADAGDLEEKRRYLGGDSEHSILVKGLDFALLEQNKARAAVEAASVDDESLEKAFAEATVVSKKRTRADILRELKEKRKKGEEEREEDAEKEKAEKEEKKERELEEPKKNGKFRPIGFKPIGAPIQESKKKKKVKEKDEGERKKKRRKVESTAANGTTAGLDKIQLVEDAQKEKASVSKEETPRPAARSESELEPMDDDFDIFAGAGEYEGVDLGDDEDEEEGEVAQGPSHTVESPPAEASVPAKANWFETEDEPPALQTGPPPILEKLKAKSRTPQPEEGEEEEQPAKLAPLAGSAIPSIKEFLKMEEEAEKEKKRKARRDKKKGKKSKDDGDSE